MADTSGKAALSILVCDDNVDAADSLALVLRSQGFDVCASYTGRKAMAMAEKAKPRIALLDIGLPDIDGYELAKTIRAEPWGSEIVLVAITGYGSPEDKRKAQQAGFDYHFTKPVAYPALEQLLNTLR